MYQLLGVLVAGKAVFVRAGGVNRNSELSSQFCCQPKTALKIQVIGTSLGVQSLRLCFYCKGFGVDLWLGN